MQSRLFPDPEPLVERLGRDFFRQLPECAGVYLMRDRAATVLYVGKAKNLRKRVGSYRVANPERMPRRTLRLLRLVEEIHYEPCGNEQAALRRESELLLALKPRFNRAGVWRGPDRFLMWRRNGERLELAVTPQPNDGWSVLGPMRSEAVYLHRTLVRLLWFACHPASSIAEMPVGWMAGRAGNAVTLHLGQSAQAISGALAEVTVNRLSALHEWIQCRMEGSTCLFSQAALEADLELLERFSARRCTFVAT